MRKPFLLLSAFLPFALAYAQGNSTGGAACRTIAQCSINFINPLYGDNKIKTLTFNYAKNSPVPKFHDVHYREETCDTIAATYCEDDTSVLRCHVYYPDTSVVDYSTCSLPAWVMFHPGGFLDCNGSYDAPDFVALCRQFARRGMVVFDGEYRRGVLLAPGLSGYGAQQLLGSYRAQQDGRGLMRSVVKQANAGGTPYRIDTSKLFVGGASAGSVIAMGIAYFSKQFMLDAVFPVISTSTILGSVNPTFYAGDTSIKYTIKGVVDMWGGLAIPPNYLSSPEDFFSQNDNMPPLIGFHGMKDITFDEKSYIIKFAKDTLARDGNNYGREGRCLLSDTANYVLHPSGGADGYFLGAQNIYEMLRRMCVPAECYLDKQMVHGLDNYTDTCYHSNFGTSSTDAATTGIYIVQRAVTFLQAVVNNKARQLQTTKFVECENFRRTCIVADDNDDCTPGPPPLCPP